MRSAKRNRCRLSLDKAAWLIALLAIGLAWPHMLAALETDSEPGHSGSETEELELFDSDVENTRHGWPQFWISAGVMNLDAKGQFRVQLPDDRKVTVIDFERVGLKENDSTPWLTMNWRSRNSRWGAWFGAWRYEVDGARLWESDLPLPDGSKIPAGALVESDFDTRWYILEASYSLWRTESVDAGIGFGLHTVDLETSLMARIEVGDQDTEIVSGDIDTLAPLPNFVVYGGWKVSQRWQISARGGWFGLTYGDYSGAMLNAYVMASFSLSPRWSLGAGYQFINLDLDVKSDGLIRKEIYDIDYAGPMGFLRFRF